MAANRASVPSRQAMLSGAETLQRGINNDGVKGTQAEDLDRLQGAGDDAGPEARDQQPF